jgi:hypothetical protein
MNMTSLEKTSTTGILENLNSLRVNLFDYRNPTVIYNPITPPNETKDPFIQNQDFILNIFDGIGSSYLIFQKEVYSFMAGLNATYIFQAVDFLNSVRWHEYESEHQ